MGNEFYYTLHTTIYVPYNYVHVSLWHLKLVIYKLGDIRMYIYGTYIHNVARKYVKNFDKRTRHTLFLRAQYVYVCII